ncbi:hypothetical protein M2140_000958 [Clostridiales Family XIII bacterium PM5-7]
MMTFLEYIAIGLVGGIVLIFLSKNILGSVIRRDDQGGDQDE